MLQGHYRQASDVAAQILLAAASDENNVVQEIRMWHAFLYAYLQGDPALAIVEGRRALELLPSDVSMSHSRAQIQVLLGKAIALASEWGLIVAGEMVEARNLVSEAAQSYWHANAQDESLSALLSLGQLYTMGFEADREKVRAVYQQVSERALKEGNAMRLADATLRLAELDFGSTQEQTSGHHHGLDTSSYQRAMDLYRQAGHVLGPADVWLSLGSHMVDSGYDGTSALQQAIELYRQEDNLMGIYSAQRALSTWYARQGNLDQAREYHRQSAAVAQEMGFPLGQATAYLGLGDYYYRSGDYARALASCEQAENLVQQPSVSAMVGLSLANIYTSMHLLDRAESACHSVIATFAPAGPSGRLSLARFILGNVLSSKGDWAAAAAAWREGLAEDEIRKDRTSQAEKLQCIAQATVMQHYRPEGPPVPEAACEEAMSLFAQSIAVLQCRQDPQAAALIANTYQLQGQATLTCGRPAESAHYLELAANIYSAIAMEMQAAITNILVGLLYYDLANRGQSDLYARAASRYEAALRYFQHVQMREMSWKVRFHLSLVSFHQGRLALTAEEQQKFWRYAASCLEDASNDIELVRGGFVASNQLVAQATRLGLVSDKGNVYIIAIRLYFRYLHDKKKAFQWLERLKGRAFLDSLALTPLRPPQKVDEALLAREESLLESLHSATNQTEVVALNEQLHAIWDQMATNRKAAEYVALRQGKTVEWADLPALLQTEEDDQR